MTTYYRVIYNYENVPFFMREAMSKWFMSNRNHVVEVVNAQLTEINAEWNLTGEPAYLGDYIEDINPKYGALMQKRLKPYMDSINKRFILFKYAIDDTGDLVGYCPLIKDSKIYIELKEEF